MTDERWDDGARREVPTMTLVNHQHFNVHLWPVHVNVQTNIYITCSFKIRIDVVDNIFEVVFVQVQIQLHVCANIQY